MKYFVNFRSRNDAIDVIDILDSDDEDIQKAIEASIAENNPEM